MQDTDDAGPHLGPAQEGSPSAMLVVRRMNDWKVPISTGELAAITGLDGRTLAATMRGLRARQRVVQLGEGTGARFQLTHLFKATT
jgi:hypothetical protein